MARLGEVKVNGKWHEAELADFDPNVLAAVAEEMEDLARQHNAQDQADRDEQMEERRHHAEL